MRPNSNELQLGLFVKVWTSLSNKSTTLHLKRLLKRSNLILQAELNSSLAQEGIDNGYGLEIGRTLKGNIEQGLLGNDLMSRIQMMTSAASDARMGELRYQP